MSNDETAKIWDANTGKLLIDLKGHTEAFRDVEISPDGQHFLTRSENGKTKIWNIITGKLIAALNSHLDYFAFYATFSLDGTKVLMACSDHTAKILDSATGQLILNLTGHTAQVISAVFIDNGNKIITISLDNTLKIWDAENGNLLVNLKGHTDMINSFALSPDGTKVVTGSLDTTVKIWNANTGTLIYDLKGHTDEIQSVEYSPDGRSILTASWDSVKIWDSGTGKLIYNIEVNKEFGPHQMFDAAFFSLDGKQITIRYGYRTKIWDIASKKLFFDTDDIKDENQKGVEDTYTGIYSPNNKQIMTVNGDVRMWDAVSRKLIFKLEGHTGWVNSADFTKDGKMIITGSDDQTAKIWDATTGQLIYTLIAVDHSEYLVYDDKGHYDGTEAARNLLYFTCGSEVIGLDQVKDQLWVPNLAERIIKGDTINAKTLSELDICGLTPEVEEGHGSTGEYYFKITPRRGGLGDTVLLVNGIEVKRYQSSELKKNGDFYELILKNEKLSNYFVEGEENQITVKSYTSDNTISSRGANPFSTKTKAPTSPPNLYAVMVGVSDYKGTQLHLKYAAKDANDISRAVENASKKLLNTDKQEHVFMYNLTTEKDHYLLPEKNGIKKVLAEIGKKATPNDILLLFFAGHGVMEGDKKQFYFLTSDASGFTNVADVGISTAELTEWIKPQNIKAQKRILIFDACNSGQAIKDFVKMGTDDQKYLAARDDENSQQIKAIDKLNEKSGLFILSASASNKSAYEMGRYSQGLLTYSLLKAIKQDPEILEDGKYLNVSRWFNAAEKTVTELSKDNGARQEPQIITSNNINIGLVDDEVIAKIILPSEKPLFASSNFQNADENIADDDLEISKLINLQLNDLATRGSDSNIVYITSTNSPDAYSLSGRYSITGNEIVMTVNIKQKKVIRNKFEIKGAKDKLNELANAVVERASELVK